MHQHQHLDTSLSYQSANNEVTSIQVQLPVASHWSKWHSVSNRLPHIQQQQAFVE